MPEKSSILLVDDDPANLMELVGILRADYKLHTAKNGATALVAAEKFVPDLILLDVIMPDMSGLEVIEKLNASETTKNIPVVLITGLSNSDDESKGLAAGAADYIKKPFEHITVKLRVRNQIRIINLQRELQDAAIAANIANRAKSDFLAKMSHELRTPMNAIVGLTELLLEEDFPQSEVKNYLKKVYSVSGLLMGLINDVLDISKIETGKLELSPVKYDVAEMLNNVINVNSFRVQNSPVEFRLDVPESLHAEFFGDDLRVKQILNNLLSNAFKFTRQGCVTLKMTSEVVNETTAKLCISVSDTGVGIPSDSIGELFQDYKQADQHMNRHIEGTGLGLSITKRLSELMGGGVFVESEYGKGTTFHIELQQEIVSDERFGAEKAAKMRAFRYEDNKKANATQRPNLSHLSILVTDDFPTNLDVARAMLGKYHLNVDCAITGQEAIDKIKSGEVKYDAIFMDYMMPGMDGVEATQHIRKIGTEYALNIPIIAMTANVVSGAEQMFLENGFQDFLSKPVTVAKIDLILHKWLLHDNVEYTPVQSNSDSGKSDIYIPGINTKLGLSYYEGDVEMFRDMLVSYAENIGVELALLKTVSEETLHDYAINVHTVKGSSAGIGAKNLSERAKTLEMLAKAGDLQGVLADNDGFLEEAEQLTKDINEFLAKG
jgi:signal transduction histidine kinase/HPt (histidine-containing phosphotransfer) domain-containing protein